MIEVVAERVQPEHPHPLRRGLMNATVLWIIAVVIAVVGVIQLIQGQILFGIILLVAAALVGPGGYSLFAKRGAHTANRSRTCPRRRSTTSTGRTASHSALRRGTASSRHGGVTRHVGVTRPQS